MNNPVPVLLLIHSLGHGGSERQLAALVRSMDRKLFTPHIATVMGGFRADALREEGVPVIQIPLRGLFAPNVLAVARDLRKYIRENGIRLVHSFDFGPALFTIAVARSCGVAALSSQRFYMDSVPPKYRAMTLAAHWLANGVVANSEALKTYLHRKLRYPLNRIDVCPNGLDAEIFCPEPRKRIDAVAAAELVIGTLCVLRPEKNLTMLLQAFAAIRANAPNARLLVVGSGPEEQALKAKAASFRLTDVSVFLPTVQDVANVLRSIDIFVHPSLSEGFPNAVMEAMACGCAVVASNVGGCPALIDDGVNGLLVDPRNADELARRIDSLIQEPDTRRKMGTAASERVRREFSTESSARALEEIYESHLSRR